MKKRNFLAVVLSVVLTASFLVLQGLEIKSATDTEQVTLQTTVAQTISLNVDSATSNLGTLTPGTPVSSSTVCTVTTNADSGYDLQVKRDDADTTIDKTTEAATNITDKTAWDATADSGDGNAAAYSGTGLGFSVYASTATKNTTWWGTGTSCHDASNLYAGFPTAYGTIMDHDSYSSSSTTASVCYRLDTASTQKSGAYDGTITYQATSKP
jgi:hypothetical protein